ncbi:MAG: hypothetical protein K9N06_13620, partial [Candidatus Cloacimonetes bacterium]|nr:hypothetical protein [Candidatus Cloacimonadota bacterium]
MYIIKKKTKNVKPGVVYGYYQLVETVSTPTGKKQRVLLYLGHLDLSADKIKILAKMIELRIHGKKESATYPELEKIVDE